MLCWRSREAPHTCAIGSTIEYMNANSRMWYIAWVERSRLFSSNSLQMFVWYAEIISTLIDRLGQPGPNKHPLVFATRFSQTYFSQYCLLTQRNFTSYYRNSGYNCTRFIFGIILGLLFGSALWGIGHKRLFFSLANTKNALASLGQRFIEDENLSRNLATIC